MTVPLPSDVANRIETLVKNGVYPSADEVLRDAIQALDERLGESAQQKATPEISIGASDKPKRESRRDKSLEKWLADFTAWANSHPPTGHFVDDSRDSIYE